MQVDPSFKLEIFCRIVPLFSSSSLSSHCVQLDAELMLLLLLKLGVAAPDVEILR